MNLAKGFPIISSHKRATGGKAMEAVRSLHRSRRLALSLGLASFLFLIPLPRSGDGNAHALIDPGLARVAHGFVNVIVQALPFGHKDAERVVRNAGGTITRELPIING